MKNGMKYQTIITVWALSLVTGGGWIHEAAASSRWSPPGRNLALNRPYQVQRTGKTTDYYLTKDEGDAVQLTDGQEAPDAKALWFFKETVAWNRGPVSVTIDLGETRAIGGMSYRTKNGPHAGVNWPPAILILVSEDGQEYRLAGELVALSARFGPPPATGRHAFVTDELKTRGRYVRLAGGVDDGRGTVPHRRAAPHAGCRVVVAPQPRANPRAGGHHRRLAGACFQQHHLARLRRHTFADSAVSAIPGLLHG